MRGSPTPGPRPGRVAGALLALPTILLGTMVAATAELAGLVVILGAVLAVERWRDPESALVA
jgi:hypothetical protein